MDLNKFYEAVNKIENNGGLGMRTPIGTVRMMYGIAKAMDAKTFIDVGTFVGLSTLWVARAMAESDTGGQIYTIELDPKWLDMAKGFAKDAGLEHIINFNLGDSRDYLPKVPIETVDLVLLDSGNKDLYPTDFENVEQYFTDDTLIIAHDVIEQDKVEFHSAWEFKAYIEARPEYESFLLPDEYGSLLIRRKN